MSSIPPLNAPVAPVITSEDESATPAEPIAVEEPKKAADKPYFVYVFDPAAAPAVDCSKPGGSSVDTVILKDERIALGSRAFHAVRMSPDDVKGDPLLQGKGREVPRLLFVTADLKSVTVLEQGKLSVSGTWDAMRTTAGRFYKQNLDDVVRELRGVLFEYDKIDSQQKVLADKEARAKDKKLTDADQKALDADRAQLDKRLKVAQEKERALFELKPKASA